jgi:hypothetical protein
MWGKDRGLVLEEVVEISFQLLKVVSPVLFFIFFMLFTIPNGPECEAFNEERAQQFAVPGIGVKFSVWVGVIHIVLLEFSPKGSEPAVHEMVPVDGFLGMKQY